MFRFILAVLSFRLVNALTASPDQIASQYQLSTSTSFPFPAATASSADTQQVLLSSWSLAKGRIQNGGDDLAFVQDPFPAAGQSSSSAAPVLQVTYPAGSFSHDTGGAQFENLWNGTTFQSMMVSYEVAFDKGFDWVKGGKLPGLRGGQNTTGCSGGSEPTGSDCFSARIMWRQNGESEVYAYIPTPNDLCDQKSINCNDDFGISISRGAFLLVSGAWNRITLLVQLNNPPDIANGNIQLYFNNVSVINQTDLQFRSSSSLSANGLFFSTFFGGSDDSWATPTETHSYFRNIELWGSSNPSNLTGEKVKSAGTYLTASWTMSLSLAVAALFRWL